MTGHVLYCFSNGKLKAIQGLLGLTPEQVDALVDVQIVMGRTGVASRHGRKICSWCGGGDMGPAPGIAPGCITHGICPECKVKVLDEVKQ